MVTDPFGRPLSNLRVSVNEACNLRCSYCHLEGGAMTAGNVTVEEYARLFRVAARLGVRHLKITGGEPTLHPHLEDIIRAGAACFEDVSMTTNGLLLAARAARYRDAGLHRVNVSIDSLDRDRYRRVTGVDALPRVLDGIRRARDAGLAPVKLNMVVLRDFNEDEVDDMVRFAAEEGVALQLIELHTDRTNAAAIDFQGGFVSLEPVEARLAREAVRVEAAPQHARKRYHLGHGDDRAGLADLVAGPPQTAADADAASGRFVEVVRPQDNATFCGDCQRLRVTGDGRLKPCLMRFDNYVDVLGALRGGADDDELERLFRVANDRRAPYWTEASSTAPRLPRLRVVPG